MKYLITLSGGMDSATALAWCDAVKEKNDQIETISFNYASKHNDQELIRAVLLSEYYQVKNTMVHLTFINDLFKSDLLKSGGDIPEGHYADESMKKTVVPFRNGIMLSIAAGYAESIGADNIVLANHAGDHTIYPDCRAEFSKPLKAAIHAGTYNGVKLLTPFGELNKTQICALGARLGVPYHLTWSCYKGLEKHCGACGTCTERKEAFKDSGVNDPTEYLEV